MTMAADHRRAIPQKVDVLGIGISAIDMSMALDTIQGWIRRRDQHYVTVTPVHALMDARRDPELRRIFNASGLATPDGMPLVWLMRLRGYVYVRRVYGPDLMLAVCEESLAAGHSHFLYGGAQGVAESLKASLEERFPFRPLTSEEDRRITDEINAANPDIVWVGISSPKQERWMAEHLGKVSAPVMIGVGAAFDFLSGRKPQAPRWMQRSGVEWLFRLATEPGRLWKRYLLSNPLFIFLVAMELFGSAGLGQDDPPKSR
jgi:N-acetylglucosaminyldiphosphoundecaprenol N-acetyl-beta-D-mannosaminyltransferase